MAANQHSERPALARAPSSASSNSKKEETEAAKPITTLTPYVNSTKPEDAEKSAGADLVRRAASNEAVDEAYNLAGEVAIEFTEEEERVVRRKTDWHVLPILTLVYFSQYLDKTLLNYASITGLPIKGTDYSNVSAAFYYGYLAFIYIQSFVAQKCNPAKYLGANVVLWGIVVACHAAAPSFAPFFALRFLLGGFESVVQPTLIMTVAAFYPKREQGKRIASFYMANGLTEIIGPLVAYGECRCRHRAISAHTELTVPAPFLQAPPSIPETVLGVKATPGACSTSSLAPPHLWSAS